MAAEKFPIEAGHIMMFARSVGDDNQIYYDDEYAKSTEAGVIIAPPTFVQASAQFDPDYFLRPKIGQPWFGSGKEPTGVSREGGGGGGGGGGSPAPDSGGTTGTGVGGESPWLVSGGTTRRIGCVMVSPMSGRLLCVCSSRPPVCSDRAGALV